MKGLTYSWRYIYTLASCLATVQLPAITACGNCSVCASSIRASSVCVSSARASSANTSSVRASSIHTSSVRVSSVRASSVRASFVRISSVRASSARASLVRTSSVRTISVYASSACGSSASFTLFINQSQEATAAKLVQTRQALCRYAYKHKPISLMLIRL